MKPEQDYGKLIDVSTKLLPERSHRGARTPRKQGKQTSPITRSFSKRCQTGDSVLYTPGTGVVVSASMGSGREMASSGCEKA